MRGVGESSVVDTPGLILHPGNWGSYGGAYCTVVRPRKRNYNLRNDLWDDACRNKYVINARERFVQMSIAPANRIAFTPCVYYIVNVGKSIYLG